MKLKEKTSPFLSSTDEIVARARRIQALVFQAPQGMHRRDILGRLSLTRNEYQLGLRHAVSAGWVEVRGHGVGARVVLREEKTRKTRNGR